MTEATDSPIVEIDQLSRRFGRKAALAEIRLTIPRGQVFGLVGANGAGKTTLLKHVLGMLKAQTGSVRVFGLDPVRTPEAVLRRVGFLSEDRDLPMWMRVSELIWYTRAFYPDWDDAYAAQLREQFQLDPRAKVKTLSRGELAKMGLLLALAHRPDLLVLDEPSSGLDPIVRREMLEALMRTVADEGRTVLFSSHLLDEVERISDNLAMMHDGRIVLQGPLAEVLESHWRLVVRFPAAIPKPPKLLGAVGILGAGQEFTYICQGPREALIMAVQGAGASVVEDGPVSLSEIFVARFGSPVDPAALINSNALVP